MLDKFKNFFEGVIQLPALKNIINLENVDLKIANIENSPLVTINKTNNQIDNSVHVTLNIGSSEVKDPLVLRESVRQLLEDHVQNEHKPVLERSAATTIESIDNSSKYQGQIDFFRGKIPSNDLLILRAAYYLRTVHEDSGSVESLKDGIRQRYGQHGANISNLCSAGYFESYMRPLYEELSKRDNFTQEMFLENYELIIRDAPFAFFVNNHHELNELIKGVTEKLVFSRRYGLHKLTIHAIGRENIAKVQRLLEDESIKAIITDDVDTSVKNNVMSVTIRH